MPWKTPKKNSRSFCFEELGSIETRQNGRAIVLHARPAAYLEEDSEVDAWNVSEEDACLAFASKTYSFSKNKDLSRTVLKVKLG